MNKFLTILIFNRAALYLKITIFILNYKMNNEIYLEP